jgi:hypothetical protein
MNGKYKPLEWEREEPVEIPPRNPPKAMEPAYPFDLMDVGDVIRINRPVVNVRQAIRYYKGKRKGVGTFIVRKITAKASRVWRTV